MFGRTVVDELRKFGIAALPGSRRPSAALFIDGEDADSIRSVLHAGDIAIDAAGPYHLRSTALIESAIEVGFDVIDLNDNLGYAQCVVSLEPQVAAAGIRVLTSASTVSAISAAMLRQSGLSAPVRATAFLAPATRRTANRATARSLLRCIGQPIQIWREGRLSGAAGWGEIRQFPMPEPLGPIWGRLFESADAVHLPRIWPSLRDVAMYVDPRSNEVKAALYFAARSRLARNVAGRAERFAVWLARRFGSNLGGVGYEFQAANGAVARCSLTAERDSYLAAVAPAVLAARAIAEDRFPQQGLVPPDRHVEPGELFAYLAAAGISVRGDGFAAAPAVVH
jgi:hypothetical protein